MISHPCVVCGAPLEGEDLEAYGEAGLAHTRAAHPELPYGDMAVRNTFEGAARMTGGADRLDQIGEVELHPVSEDRIDDWLAFFDFDATVTTPHNAACYCLEPHELAPHQPQPEPRHWRERRKQMVDLLRRGIAFGYLAYVDGRPAGWVNASRRADCSLYRRGDEVDETTVSVACITIAPPYQGHGLARLLLDRVIADAAARGATAVEAYPPNADVPAGMNYRGGRGVYDDAGFTEVKVRTYDTVVRLPTGRG
jgi:GNAT superfamily N-acetyltransferase